MKKHSLGKLDIEYGATKNPRGAGRKPKLLPLQKMDVFAMYLQGVPTYEILAEYQISQSTFDRIIKEISQEMKGNE